MGIHSLYKYISENVDVTGPNPPIKKCSLEDFAGKKIAFDSNALAYKFRFGNRPNTHIIECGRLVAECVSLDITPVFVWDGDHPEEKDEENQRRREEKLKFIRGVTETKEIIKKRKIECGFDSERSIDSIREKDVPEEKRDDYLEIQKMEDDLEKEIGSKVIVTETDIAQMKEIIRLTGRNTFDVANITGGWNIDAPSEGEAMCALLNRLGIVDYISADDADVFAFRGLKLIRDIGWKSSRNVKMMLYDIPKILKCMKIDYEELVEVCIMCENDFNKSTRLKGYGFAKALKVIKAHGTPEEFVEYKLQEQERKRKKQEKAKPRKSKTDENSNKRKRASDFEVPEGFEKGMRDTRKIFLAYGKAKKITDVISEEQLYKERDNKFNMQKAIYFFHKNGMNYQIEELKTWAKLIQGKEYEEDELEDMIRNEQKKERLRLSDNNNDDSDRESDRESKESDSATEPLSDRESDVEVDEENLFCVEKSDENSCEIHEEDSENQEKEQDCEEEDELL